MKWLCEKWRAWRHKRAICRLRKTLLWFGVSTQHLSDEDIAREIIKITNMFRGFGISAVEAAQSLRGAP